MDKSQYQHTIYIHDMNALGLVKVEIQAPNEPDRTDISSLGNDSQEGGAIQNFSI